MKVRPSATPWTGDAGAGRNLPSSIHFRDVPGGNRVTEVVQATIQFPYKRSLGPVVGAFMTALTDRRIIGIRSGDRVIVPAAGMGSRHRRGARARLRRRRPRRHRRVVVVGRRRRPRSTRSTVPFAFALVQLDGADTSLLHAVDAGSIDAMSTGMRVAPRWRATRIGHITDIEAFVPGEDAGGAGRRRRPGRGAGRR